MMQSSLPLLLPQSYAHHDFFVNDCNIEAYRLITNACELWPNKRILIIADSGGGKSHLAGIWQQKHNAVDIGSEEAFDQLSIVPNQKIIIENIEKFLNNDGETFLLNAINIATTHHSNLLLTASLLPQYTIPDLRSRINATYKVLIKEPDKKLVKILLQKQCTNMQINITQDVIDYISDKIIFRDYRYIKSFLELMNKWLFNNKKQELNITFIKKLLLHLY